MSPLLAPPLFLAAASAASAAFFPPAWPPHRPHPPTSCVPRPFLRPSPEALSAALASAEPPRSRQVDLLPYIVSARRAPPRCWRRRGDLRRAPTSTPNRCLLCRGSAGQNVRCAGQDRAGVDRIAGRTAQRQSDAPDYRPDQERADARRNGADGLAKDGEAAEKPARRCR